jgi:hypothetical protein
LLPAPDDRLREGDELLFCGRSGAHSSMRWTLQNIHALTYVLHGESPPRGIVWDWLLRRRRLQADAASGPTQRDDDPPTDCQARG